MNRLAYSTHKARKCQKCGAECTADSDARRLCDACILAHIHKELNGQRTLEEKLLRAILRRGRLR